MHTCCQIHFMPSSNYDLAAINAQIKQYWQPGTESDCLRLVVRTPRPRYWMNVDVSTEYTLKMKQPLILIKIIMVMEICMSPLHAAAYVL